MTDETHYTNCDDILMEICGYHSVVGYRRGKGRILGFIVVPTTDCTTNIRIVRLKTYVAAAKLLPTMVRNPNDVTRM